MVDVGKSSTDAYEPGWTGGSLASRTNGLAHGFGIHAPNTIRSIIETGRLHNCGAQLNSIIVLVVMIHRHPGKMSPEI